MIIKLLVHQPRFSARKRGYVRARKRATSCAFPPSEILGQVQSKLVKLIQCEQRDCAQVLRKKFFAVPRSSKQATSREMICVYSEHESSEIMQSRLANSGWTTKTERCSWSPYSASLSSILVLVSIFVCVVSRSTPKTQRRTAKASPRAEQTNNKQCKQTLHRAASILSWSSICIDSGATDYYSSSPSIHPSRHSPNPKWTGATSPINWQPINRLSPLVHWLVYRIELMMARLGENE